MRINYSCNMFNNFKGYISLRILHIEVNIAVFYKTGFAEKILLSGSASYHRINVT